MANNEANRGELEKLIKSFNSEARKILRRQPTWSESQWLRFSCEWMEARSLMSAVDRQREMLEPPTLRSLAAVAETTPEALTRTASGPGEWLSVPEAAKVAGVSHWTVRSWMKREFNQLPHRQPFHRAKIVIAKRALLAWIEQGTV